MECKEIWERTKIKKLKSRAHVTGKSPTYNGLATGKLV